MSEFEYKEFCLGAGGCRYIGDGDTIHGYECVEANNRLIAVVGLLNAMEMQEQREQELFHMPADVARAIWDRAKQDAIETFHLKRRT